MIHSSNLDKSPPTLTTPQSWNRIQELLSEDRLVVLNFHTLVPLKVSEVLSDAAIHNMIDKLLEDDDHENEQQGPTDETNGGGDNDEIPSPPTLSRTREEAYSPTPPNSPTSHSSPPSRTSRPSAVLASGSLIPISYSHTGFKTSTQKRFFLDESLMFRSGSAKKLKTVEKSNKPLKNAFGKLVVRADLKVGSGCVKSILAKIDVEVDGSKFYSQLKDCMPYLQPESEESVDGEDIHGQEDKEFGWVDCDSPVASKSRLVTIVVVNITHDAVPPSTSLCAPSSKNSPNVWKDDISVSPLTLEVGRDDDFPGRAPYVHYVYSENGETLYSWHETEGRGY